jgi:hypothetical protein
MTMGFRQLTHSQLISVGKVAADRDCFVVLHHLASLAHPSSVTELCALYQAEPPSILEILAALRRQRFVTRVSRGYVSTDLGKRAIGLLQEITRRVSLDSTTGASEPAATTLAPSFESQDIPVVGSWTNNGTSNLATVMFSGSTVAGGAPVPQIKPAEIKTEAPSELSNDTKSDAEPAHSYM